MLLGFATVFTADFPESAPSIAAHTQRVPLNPEPSLLPLPRALLPFPSRASRVRLSSHLSNPESGTPGLPAGAVESLQRGAGQDDVSRGGRISAPRGSVP